MSEEQRLQTSASSGDRVFFTYFAAGKGIHNTARFGDSRLAWQFYTVAGFLHLIKLWLSPPPIPILTIATVAIS
ncbi:hypothetical protein [Thermocoleostomius sinensis]|uniref:Uncharacterized protein n=1 Tax=Thermocoleostomius sinensis A174 TaxID=2016057 RepID=A0A9E9CCH3_9CYAN|nr:hypothetical protein [Thermocoleostomius sinensis]WAL62930.1 hypothetical protein OXH18_14205 [Thermocoleostomius sinensis A174]